MTRIIALALAPAVVLANAPTPAAEQQSLQYPAFFERNAAKAATAIKSLSRGV